MPQVQIKIMGEPSLLEPSKPVAQFDAALTDLIKNLKAMMQEKKGVGIAAPQIGENIRVIIFGFEKNPRYPNEQPIAQTVLINPEYEILSDKITFGWEGCLSVPGMRGLVPRYERIKYRGLDEHGEVIERIVENFHARIIQHEIDHLDGILYPFRINNLKDFGFEEVLFPKIYANHQAL